MFCCLLVFSGQIPPGIWEEQGQLHPHHLRPHHWAREEEHTGLQWHQLPRHPETCGGDGEETCRGARSGDHHWSADMHCVLYTLTTLPINIETHDIYRSYKEPSEFWIETYNKTDLPFSSKTCVCGAQTPALSLTMTLLRTTYSPEVFTWCQVGHSSAVT